MEENLHLLSKRKLFTIEHRILCVQMTTRLNLNHFLVCSLNVVCSKLYKTIMPLSESSVPTHKSITMTSIISNSNKHQMSYFVTCAVM
jgi:hypothetical protein